MHTSNEPSANGKFVPSNSRHGIRQPDRGFTSMPCTRTSGLLAAISAPTVPSPHPMSNTEAFSGSSADNISASTRTLLSNTSQRCPLAIHDSNAESECEFISRHEPGPFVLSFQFVISDIRSAANSQHAQEKRSENSLQAQKQPHGPEQYLPNLRQRAKSTGDPLPCHPRAARQPGKKQHAAQQQSRFQCHPFQHALQRHCSAAIESLRITEHLGKRSDRKYLRPQQRENHAKNHGVHVHRNPRRNRARSRQEPKNQEQPQQHKRRPRQYEQPVWRVQQHEPQVPPAIPETPQMRRPTALVRPQRNWNLRHLRAKLRRLDHKLRCKFHPRAAQIHALIHRPSEPAHPAMTIANPRMKK